MLRFALFSILGSLCVTGVAFAQSAARSPLNRNAQAVSIVRQCVLAGGNQAVGKVLDFSATGQVTYESGKAAKEGQVTILGKSTSSFSLTTQLPDGSESWAVLDMKGHRKDIHGAKTSIPPHNLINLGALTFPLLSLYELLASSTAGMELVGKATRYGREVYQVRTERYFQEKDGKPGILSTLSIRDFFIDVESFQILGVSWTSHPVNDFNQRLIEEVEFSNFQQVEGVTVPFNATDYLAGQKRWTIQLEKIQFNQGISDSAFQE